MVREVLEVFVRVCIFLDQPMFLSFVFKAISSRLDYVSSAHVVPLHKSGYLIWQKGDAHAGFELDNKNLLTV